MLTTVSDPMCAQSADWAWTPGARHSVEAPWPPKGLRLSVDFEAPRGRCGCYCGLRATVVYELYDGLPTFGKWHRIDPQTLASRSCHQRI